MPPRYERKTLRASWSEKNLIEAMEKVRSKQLGVNEAARTYKIPSRTLRRHLQTGKFKVPLGRAPVFNKEYERKLVAHIQKLEKVGFAPDRKDVREMAYMLAKKLKIKNPFPDESGRAGNIWLNGFLTRNPELSQRKSEGLSLARAYGVNRKDVQEFFDLLAKTYEEHDLQNNPANIFNMDETGIQVNNKPGKVVATKGVKDVYTLTSSEKGENVTVIACVNAEGNFLPPTLIYKGTYCKPQFSEGLPPGSEVYMNKKSSYINSDLFLKWFEEVFLRKKGPGTALLILDGHSSHSNNIRLLEVAKENNVELLCFPSHTTHALQPLDRVFFRPLKVYFAQEAKSWMIMNKDKKLTRYDISKLIGKAWGKAASVSNGVSALKSTGIYPYDPNAIPEHYFSLSDALQVQGLVANDQEDIASDNQTTEEELITQAQPRPGSSGMQKTTSTRTSTMDPTKIFPQNEPLPGPSGMQESISSLTMAMDHIERFPQKSLNILEIDPIERTTQNQLFPGLSGSRETLNPLTLAMDYVEKTPQKSVEPLLVSPISPSIISMAPTELTPQKYSQSSLMRKSISPRFLSSGPIEKTPFKSFNILPEPVVKVTPSKVLSDIHPVPILPSMSAKNKQKAVILTSPEHVEKKRAIAERKKSKNMPKKPKNKMPEKKLTKKSLTQQNKKNEPKAVKNKNNKDLSSSESNDEIEDLCDKSRKENIEEKQKNETKKRFTKKSGKKLTNYTKRARKSKKNKVYSSSSDEMDEKEDTSLSEEEISDEDVNKCGECTENYYTTKSNEDWIQCPKCLSWLHEFCTMYNPMCNRCGRKAKREALRN